MDDLVVPEVPELTADEVGEDWIRSAQQLNADLTRVIGKLRDNRQPSIDLFIPNYWKVVVDLPETQSRPLLELWYLAHDIGKETMRTGPRAISRGAQRSSRHVVS